MKDKLVNMIDWYKESIKYFKELSFGEKVIYLLMTLILTIVMILIIYTCINFVLWVIA